MRFRHDRRAYYPAKTENFLMGSPDKIFAKVTKIFLVPITDRKKASWYEEIDNILKENLIDMTGGRILLEYTIPRGIIFAIEFKIGDNEYRMSTDDQVPDYAIDLKIAA